MRLTMTPMNGRNRLVMKTLLFVAIYIGLITGSDMAFWKALMFVFILYLITGGHRFAYIFYMTVGRDLKSLLRFKKTQLYLYILKRQNATVPKLFAKLCQTHASRVLFYFEDQKWTFGQIDELSNRVANLFLEYGYHPGQEVALFMDNRPEYVAIWLGLAKAGIVTALINTNQRLHQLVHSITVVNCKAIIFGSELTDAVREVMPSLNSNCSMQYFCYGDIDTTNNITNAKSLKQLISESSCETPRTLNMGKFCDRLFYIYTSGTTGLPKAAIIKHSRYLWMGSAMKNMIKLRNDEVIYTSLPLYHLAGGTCGTCQCLIFGNSMAIRSKFSASNFWKDCIKYNCTAAQYIGEICRYLLAQKPQPYDNQHNLRIMFGNGLRPKIWREFTQRFNIKEVGEMYGSTEGNANMINVDNKEGSCGFISQIAAFLYPASLVRIKESTGEYIRDENGVCVHTKAYETGEFVGKIIDSDPSRSFDGYANKEATKKKIITDVFSKGDRAFASGDLLTMDEFGYLYFKDRTGDTFRWKGENVSTMEIETIISKFIQLVDCVVYGVEVPGCEGKAGMAAILDQNNGLDLNRLLQNLKKVLPSFSIPVFIRICKCLEMTGTHKLPKNSLQNEGYDPNLIQEPIYFFDAKKDKYLRLDDKLYRDIQNSLVRF
ncbi:long-chain fatty acid transport protein 4-like [Oppia nitens]|uniref:long-chain fatty acid transport protein 4-like n=1 Tax=Oppia nitens TaxID=1686743 RepID=UPI0023DCE517|nr:long-chain fatty acid transport protein 4-like [Oppia nitens]XP_054158009.1 long-chain fatty acid transport protein 4-like [Oppia nitens]XP_054158010.1 long-chain fatty acid transport protein 4-like [Oppia nitens]